LDYWDGDVSASGFVAHEDTVQGREAGKSDPGPFDRARFIASLEDDMLTAEDMAWLEAKFAHLELRQNEHGDVLVDGHTRLELRQNEHGTVRDKAHEAILAKLGEFQVGGVDVAALAEAVADKLAERLKD
jgi:hypothetical protein